MELELDLTEWKGGLCEGGLRVTTCCLEEQSLCTNALPPLVPLSLSLRGLLVPGVSLVCDQVHSIRAPGPAICRTGLKLIERQTLTPACVLTEGST